MASGNGSSQVWDFRRSLYSAIHCGLRWPLNSTAFSQASACFSSSLPQRIWKCERPWLRRTR